MEHRSRRFTLAPMVKPDSTPKATPHVSLHWLSLAIVAFYWQIVFHGAIFSMLTVGETVNQAYSWIHFWAESVRHGSVPLWDPYTFGGHSFIGEMQTAAFYPLHLGFRAIPGQRKRGCCRRGCIISTSYSRICWLRISCSR